MDSLPCCGCGGWASSVLGPACEDWDANKVHVRVQAGVPVLLVIQCIYLIIYKDYFFLVWITLVVTKHISTKDQFLFRSISSGIINIESITHSVDMPHMGK